MEKINVAELLKDCPNGMELDCVLFENLEFDRIDKDTGAYSIICRVKTEWGCYNTHTFTEYGCYTTDKYSKCAIFPKGKTTWEGFQMPFKDGDVVTNIEGAVIIYKGITTYGYCGSFVSLDRYNQLVPHYQSYLTGSIRLSTEEEKQKLFAAIKDCGYRWNAETNTLVELVKPKFKVGDRIRTKKDAPITISNILITKVNECGYKGVIGDTTSLANISFKYQDTYELVPDKFDITTLKPFESRVLVRSESCKLWKPAIFGCCVEGAHSPYYALGGTCWKYCIPYEGNEHLSGTTDDCDAYYKTWE